MMSDKTTIRSQLEADQRKCVETAEAICFEALEGQPYQDEVWEVLQPLIALTAKRSFVLAARNLNRRIDEHLWRIGTNWAKAFIIGVVVGVTGFWLGFMTGKVF